jgi:hypothetical protein
MGDVRPTKPKHPQVYDVERDGYDRNMDFAMQMRDRRSYFEYIAFDYPIGVARFSYFRSRLESCRLHIILQRYC